MKPIDPIQLQRLVDGELDPREVQMVLSEANNSPDQWQEIAVGFVEDQLWNRAFGDDPNPSTVDAEHDSKSSGKNVGSGLQSDIVNRAKADQPIVNPTRSKSVHSPGVSWLVMAASLVVAATIGYMFSSIQNRSLPGNSIAKVESPGSSSLLASNSEDKSSIPKSNAETALADEPQPQMTLADYHLEVPNEKLDDLNIAGQASTVPLISVKNAGDLRELNRLNEQSSPTVSPEMLKRLGGSGYHLKQDVDFLSGRLGDGRSFVVPVRTTRFVSGQ